MSVENQPNKSPIESAQFKGLTCASKTKENQWRMGSNINRLDQSRYKRKSRWHQKKICKSRWRTRKIERASFAIVACKQLICFIIPLPAKIKLFFFWQERGWEKTKKIIPETVLVKSHRRKSLVIDTKKKNYSQTPSGSHYWKGANTHTKNICDNNNNNNREGRGWRTWHNQFRGRFQENRFPCHRQYKQKMRIERKGPFLRIITLGVLATPALSNIRVR